MLLLSQIDEPTFAELTKRLHRKMKKDHQLQMPLSKLREVTIQAVGYRSLHDARQAWKRQSALPLLPLLNEPLERLPATLRPSSSRVSQRPLTAWNTLPKPIQDAQKAIEQGTFVAWARQRPTLLKALTWRSADEQGNLSKEKTATDLLLEAGPKGWEAFRELVEEKNLALTHDVLEALVSALWRSTATNRESARAFLDWATSMLTETADKEALLLNLFNFQAQTFDSDHDKLYVIQGALQTLTEQCENAPALAAHQFTHLPLFENKGMELAWSTYDDSKDLPELLIYRTFQQGNSLERAQSLERAGRMGVAMELLTRTAKLVLEAGQDHGPFLAAVFSTAEKIAAQTASKGELSSNQIPKNLLVPRLHLFMLLGALLRREHYEDFVALISHPALSAHLVSRFSPIRSEEALAFLQGNPPSHLEKAIWEFISPSRSTDPSSKSTHLNPLVELYVSQCFQADPHAPTVPPGVMAKLQRLVASPWVDLQARTEGALFSGLPPETGFGKLLLQTQFSPAWVEALVALGMKLDEPLMYLSNRWVEPLVFGLASGHVDPRAPAEHWYRLGSLPIGCPQALQDIAVHLFGHHLEAASLKRLVQNHRLVDQPQALKLMWSHIQCVEQAQCLLHLAGTKPDAQSVCWWMYGLKQRPTSAIFPTTSERFVQVGRLLELALEWGVDINASFEDDRQTPLHWASIIPWDGNLPSDPVVPLMKILVAAGSNPSSLAQLNEKGALLRPRDWLEKEERRELERKAHPYSFHHLYQERLAYLQEQEMLWALKQDQAS